MVEIDKRPTIPAPSAPGEMPLARLAGRILFSDGPLNASSLLD